VKDKETYVLGVLVLEIYTLEGGGVYLEGGGVYLEGGGGVYLEGGGGDLEGGGDGTL
jgi:hypothetical protein